MCKSSTPKYEKPPSYARAKEPDEEALYNEAVTRAAMANGGLTRSTVLTGLASTATPPTLGRQTARRSATALG